MSHTTSPTDQMMPQGSHEWVQHLPDGAVSIGVEGAALVLRASKKLQKRFETLLAGGELAGCAQRRHARTRRFVAWTRR
jgi:hypothetical protein